MKIYSVFFHNTLDSSKDEFLGVWNDKDQLNDYINRKYNVIRDCFDGTSEVEFKFITKGTITIVTSECNKPLTLKF